MRPQTPAFDQYGDRPVHNGLVFACPHAGRVYPDDLRPAPDLPVQSLRCAEDAQVDELIAPAKIHAIPTLVARISRAYVDLNRAAEDRDPSLTPDWPLAKVSARARAGYGVIPRLTGDGRAIYDRDLDRSEVEDRLAWAFHPYHQALERIMQQARAQSMSAQALLIDWHSMPERAAGGVRGPDVILGNRHGQSCTPALTRCVQASFERAGFRVALNQPYAGGWTTQVWGRPQEGLQALQIELNRGLYWDEDAHMPSAGWNRCCAVIRQVIDDLVRFDPAAG